jgi:hypothetical protein
MLTPIISFMRASKTACLEVKCPENEKPVHTKAIKVPRVIVMHREATTISLS